MSITSFFNLDTLEGLEDYVRKSRINLEMFEKLFGSDTPEFSAEGCEENIELMRKISQMTGMPYDKVLLVNLTDELMSCTFDFNQNFGCTSVGRNGIIGQNLDFFVGELCIVKEKDTLYVTAPPYMALLGMNSSIAVCVNYIPSDVEDGISIAHIRRNLLRLKSIDEVITYIQKIKPSSNLNVMISDGDEIVDIEVDSGKVKIHYSISDDNGTFLAHTNHIVSKPIVMDRSCPRLVGAFQGLKANRGIEKILQSSGVYVPVSFHAHPVVEELLGFGSITTVIMDVKDGTLKHKDYKMGEYETFCVR